MNELALFAGAGGGILGGHLLGWRTVCAVEYAAYPASVLLARQNDGILPPFPIWDDVRTFSGKPWRGIVDVISGGFPCQDISSAGKGAGIDGERSGMWSHMARIIGEVRPRFVFVENSPVLTSRGLGKVLGDLAALGYDSKWMCLSAADCGAKHKRDRIWILAYPNMSQCERGGVSCGISEIDANSGGRSCSGDAVENVANPTGIGQQGQREYVNSGYCEKNSKRQASNALNERQSQEWPVEPNVGRVANGVAARVDRLTAIGNGQVPRVAAAAFSILSNRGEGEQR